MVAHAYSGEALNAFNYAVGCWDMLRHERKVTEPHLFAASVGSKILLRYPVLCEVAATYDPPLTCTQLAEQIAVGAFASSSPNYWRNPVTT
jgi:hypothetical protein